MSAEGLFLAEYGGYSKDLLIRLYSVMWVAGSALADRLEPRAVLNGTNGMGEVDNGGE